MTAAVRAQLLAAGAKLPVEAPKKPLTPRTPLPAPKEPREPQEAGRSGETALPEKRTTLPPPDTGTPGGPCAWLFNYGRTSFSLAGDHFGERYRLVLTLPKDPALLRALLDTVATYYATLKA